jgi:hypothetical protein
LHGVHPQKRCSLFGPHIRVASFENSQSHPDKLDARSGGL